MIQMVHQHFAREAGASLMVGVHRYNLLPMAGASRMSPSLLLLHGLKKHGGFRHMRCELTQSGIKIRSQNAYRLEELHENTVLFIMIVFFPKFVSVFPKITSPNGQTRLIRCNFFESTNNHPPAHWAPAKQVLSETIHHPKLEKTHWLLVDG